MNIEHLALWVDDLERMRAFYMTYFGFTSGDKYTNLVKNYTAYFLSCGPGKTRLELMHQPDINDQTNRRGFSKGLAHFAVSVGSKEAVDRFTEFLRADQCTIASEPRMTGDGYYESVVLDPEGNYVEITV